MTTVQETQFPRVLAGREFFSVEEIEEYLKEIREEGRSIIKEIKGTGRKGRAKSPRRLLMESVIEYLNQNYVLPNDVGDKLSEGPSSQSVSVKFNVETQEFYLPVYNKQSA